MKILKYVVISVIFVVIITVVVLLYLWLGKGFMSSQIPKINSDLKIQGVRLIRSIAGKTEWELKAKSADYFKDEGVTHLELPDALFYDKNNMRIELKGDKGEVFNNTNDIAVSGNVKVATDDGYTLYSDSLRYYAQKRMVVTESKVFVDGKGIKVEGLGMMADIDSGRVIIKKDVKAILEGRL